MAIISNKELKTASIPETIGPSQNYLCKTAFKAYPKLDSENNIIAWWVHDPFKRLPLLLTTEEFQNHFSHVTE